MSSFRLSASWNEDRSKLRAGLDLQMKIGYDYGRGEKAAMTLLNGSVPARFPEDRDLEEDVGLWWVIHTKPNCEKQVATYLLNRGISYFLPLYLKKTRFGNLGRIRTSEVPLFTGYLCLALDRPQHTLLYDTKKFVRIIKVDDQESFVKELKGVAAAVKTEQDIQVRAGLVPGKRVLILDGPLEGTEGVVVKHRGERRLALSVHMFNQTMLVNLDPLTRVQLV
jgi:transcription antitermination factor NusG